MPDYATPYGKFHQQRLQAKHRGIEWMFTFEHWWDFWQKSGQWHLRGKGFGTYVMARRGDEGPYSASNCYICPFEENMADGRARRKPRVRVERPRTEPRTIRGWSYIKRATNRPYQVCVAGRYIGCYATQAEAEAAYANSKGLVTHDPSVFCASELVITNGNELFARG